MTNKLTEEQRQLVADNHNLIYGFMKKSNLQSEEWYGIIAIGLIKAAMNYSADSGAQFSTYAYRCMHNEYRNELKHRAIWFPENLSLDFEYSHKDGDSYTIANSYVGEEDFTSKYIDEGYSFDLYGFFESKCATDAQRKALQLMARNVPIGEVIEESGITRQAISLLKKKLRREYMKHHDENGNLKPFKVGDTMYFNNKPYKFRIVARDNRFIICIHSKTETSDFDNIVIDLENRVYGTILDATEYGFYKPDRCKKRLKELYTGEISINTNIKNIDFLVA